MTPLDALLLAIAILAIALLIGELIGLVFIAWLHAKWGRDRFEE